jgi:hypothetical protein
MVTPAECGKIDPALANMSDVELTKVLGTLYGPGELALDSCVSRLNSKDM